jgi:hypothetical protein
VALDAARNRASALQCAADSRGDARCQNLHRRRRKGRRRVEHSAAARSKIGRSDYMPDGAGKWRASYTEILRGRHCVIVPDRDEPGEAHAQAVAASLYGVAASVAITNWNKLWPERTAQPGKFDIADYIAAHPDSVLPL